MPTPSPSPQAVTLPNPATQSYIHELAKTIPAPRKQNTACDACRARKVKCNRTPGDDKCQHCLSKNYPCTNYVQQATTQKKRSGGVQRRARGISSATMSVGPYPRIYTNATGEHDDMPGSSYTNGQTDHSVSSQSSPGPPAFPDGLSSTPVTLYTTTVQLLTYLFAPPAPPREATPPSSTANRYSLWGDAAVRLDDSTYRAEFALELVEVFFQIVHTRWPLLNPEHFRRSLNLPIPGTPGASSAEGGNAYPSPASASPTSDKPLHPALVATVLAWGAKFSQYQILVDDRAKNGGQGLLAKTLIDRTRDIAEALKVHRIPTPEHVLVGVLLEPLQAQNQDDPTGYQGFWLTAALRHLIALQFNHKSVVANIQDTEQRAIMIFAWWMATLCDGYSAVYYRRKPFLEDDDYDIDVYSVEAEGTDPQTVSPSTRAQLEFLGYYRANHALVRIARRISRWLWRPAVEAEGIPYAVLCQIIKEVKGWQAQYLQEVGMGNSAVNLDFISAISACASDATYHVFWVILFNAVDDFGIREVNEHHLRNGTGPLGPHPFGDIEGTKQLLMDEALNAALRISGLAGVLATNGYLKLDPAVMHVSCIQAGMLLARLARPEASNCCKALQQYSLAYEEAAEQGIEIERTYGAALAGEWDINHMASVAPRPPSGG